MKHLVFALLALFLLFSMVSCKNTPDSAGNTAIEDSQATEGTSDPNSASVKALHEKIQFDMITERSKSYPDKPLFEETLSLLTSVRPVWYNAGPENKAEITRINDRLLGFFTSYEAHQMCTDDLDSLSVHLLAGKISDSDAQKKYETIKAKMLEEGKKMEEAKAGLDIPALSTEFDDIIKGANTKAAGGR